MPAFAIDSHPVTNGAVPGLPDRGRLSRAEPVERLRLGVARNPQRRAPGVLAAAGRGVAAAHDVRRPVAAVRVAGVREPRRGVGVCALARVVASTEAQFHRAAYGTLRRSTSAAYPWGDAAPAPRLRQLRLRALGSHRRSAPIRTATARSVCSDLVGNGWEWTSSEFEPLPGFEAFPFYAGYSANFFDGKHYVMKGGSARTAACMLRRSFRNWFQPHYPLRLRQVPLRRSARSPPCSCSPSAV